MVTKTVPGQTMQDQIILPDDQVPAPSSLDVFFSGDSNKTLLISDGEINKFIAIVLQENGRARPADITSLDDLYLCYRIAISYAAQAFKEIQAQTFGRLADNDWSWTAGLPIYVGANGVLTQTKPTSPAAVWTRIIAVAETPRIIMMQQFAPEAL